MISQTISQQLLDHYNISGFHANVKQGGQKTVFFPVRDGKKQVLKLFQNGYNDRLDRELEIYDKFKHLDSIPQIISVENFNGCCFIFEEFIEGDTLCDIENRFIGQSPLITQLLKDIFEVMTPIWEQKLVHRDIKPENIIIRENGKPVIIDFGIARDLDGATLTGTGFQPMSWRFASPEQYAGDKFKISYRTDFFSLGTLAYYLYHGQLPFGNSHNEISTKFQNNDESFTYNSAFTLHEFCREAMKFSVSERPRAINDLIKLL
ncbi:protein kinase [Rudanella paleaurantiibacter]|uniref:Protein kinase n=1 Tax=Rudanella paleaurantiibacter TaxID=2614655 RepID=A0A7J5U451_9BACT|nr:protein kinase [Rudanella paleaurantiibacter]KAB7731815.1 protein kinase [Rudanella paleaurantiibacter]